MINLHYSSYDEKTKTLYGIHQSGFYSCINCLRVSLYRLISNNIIPQKISLENTLYWYKNNYTEDYYPLLYKTDLSKLNQINCNFTNEFGCPTSIKYNNFDFKNCIPIENVYFLPSDYVNNTTENLIKKYNIDLSKTIAILHRGNDKWKETKLSPVDKWIEIIEKKYKNGYRILIQTDEASAKERFLNHFKDISFVFEEMIFNDNIDSNIKPDSNKKEWALNFESIMRIISKCNMIITHTGNCGIIPIIYRKNINNTLQFFNDEIIDNIT
jgi:hypothetical protein